jgi:hypothetical protein
MDGNKNVKYTYTAVNIRRSAFWHTVYWRARLEWLLHVICPE